MIYCQFFRRNLKGIIIGINLNVNPAKNFSWLSSFLIEAIKSNLINEFKMKVSFQKYYLYLGHHLKNKQFGSN